MTNADRIRQMTDEELSDFLETITDCCSEYQCDECPIGVDGCDGFDILVWLKRKVQE